MVLNLVESGKGERTVLDPIEIEFAICCEIRVYGLLLKPLELRGFVADG